MQNAIALGKISGYGGGIAAPEDKITREQAAVILYKVLRLNVPDAATTMFTVMGGVSSWARDAVLAMEQSGYVVGNNNQYMPKQNITRGEAAQMLVNVFGVIVDENLDAGGATYKNVTIRKTGVTLKNVVITGDLFITEGVGDGDVLLDTVNIGGRLLAAGGGGTVTGTGIENPTTKPSDPVTPPSDPAPTPVPSPDPTPAPTTPPSTGGGDNGGSGSTTTYYTVTFNSNGGSTVASQSIASGGKVAAPATPIRSGFTFSGWYKEAPLTNVWTFGTDTVTSSIMLYAKPTPSSCRTTTMNPTTRTAAKIVMITVAHLTVILICRAVMAVRTRGA